MRTWPTRKSRGLLSPLAVISADAVMPYLDAILKIESPGLTV